jgi:CRISPR/Cas system-associated exonuclease Cas4 (RecB family)
MQPDAAQMPGEVLSPSQASTFLGCSAKYRFKYVLGLPEPAGGGAAREDVEGLKASGLQLAGKYLREAAPSIQPLAVEVPVCGEIAGVRVRGIVDILDADGRIIDVKTASRKPSKISGDHAFQLATYTALLDPSVSGETRIDSLVSTKDPQLVQIEHTPGKSGRRLVERMYPLVAEGIANGLFIPNRASTLCSYCPYRSECEAEYGGAID